MTLPQARHYFINNYLRYVRKRISIGLWIKYMERRAEELPEARDNINRVLDVTREVVEGYDEYTDANWYEGDLFNRLVMELCEEIDAIMKLKIRIREIRRRLVAEARYYFPYV